MCIMWRASALSPQHLFLWTKWGIGKKEKVGWESDKSYANGDAGKTPKQHLKSPTDSNWKGILEICYKIVQINPFCDKSPHKFYIIIFMHLLLSWFYWLFYDHFSARSLLAKLGRNEMKWWCFRPLLCTLFRLNWAKQTPGIMRRN